MAGKIQNEDVKTLAELLAAGGVKAQLTNDTKIYVTALGIAKTLEEAITDGDIGGGLIWSTTTGTTQAMVPRHGYVADNAAQIDFTLPVTAAYGTSLGIAGKGAGGWKISQNAGQYIYDVDNQTVVGVLGGLQSNENRTCVELLCVIADTLWVIRNVNGSVSNLSSGLYALGGSNTGGSGGPAFSIDYVFKFDSTLETGSNLVATISLAREEIASNIKDTTKGYAPGGNSPGPFASDVIDRLTFATDTTSVVVAVLPTPITIIAGSSSSLAGYTGGGFNPTTVTDYDIIQKILFGVTESTSTLVAVLSTTKGGAGCTQKSTKGYTVSGNVAGTTFTSSIDALTFVGETVATLVAVMTTPRFYATCISSSLYGYFGGGGNAFVGFSSVERLDLTLETMSVLVTTLNREGGTGVQAPSKGFAFAGYPNPSGLINDTIDKLDFTLETFSSIAGLLPQVTRLSAGVSN